MDDTYWIDEDFHGFFAKHSLAKLISSYLEPVNPFDAVTKTIRVVYLLLLSNHLTKAHELLTALCERSPAIIPSKSDVEPPLKYASMALKYFWHTHPEYTSLEQCTLDERNLDSAQWGKYRECTRTGWMLEHCRLEEPSDPHIWMDTDDPRMLAMCARLLAKDKKEGKYPPKERLSEALDAAKKLYRQPQVCLSDWDYKKAKADGVYRHNYLLYRRLVVEIAIRVGDLESAVEMMSLGLNIDGFAIGSELEVYLMIPGIYDVLPLLARRGNAGSPYFIEESVAEEVVKQIVATLELRATKGRQWSLSPEKVDWEELLKRLARAAWKVNRKEYKEQGLTSAKEILYEPATEEGIQQAEAKCGELPEDFKQMVRVANGFRGGHHLFGGGILGLNGLRVAEEEDITSCGLRDAYPSHSMLQLEPGTECDAFNHFIVTPAAYKAHAIEEGQTIREGEYMYWHWAYWRGGGETCFKSVREYVASCVEEVEAMAERGEKMDHGRDSDQDPYSDEEDESQDDAFGEESWVFLHKED